MLGLTVDLHAHVMLASMAGTHAPEDHARVYDAIEKLDRSGRESGHAIALVFVVARDNVSPDAHWRRRFAEQRKTLGSPHIYLSVVTESPIVRGVLTAISWIVPEPANMTSDTHATFDASAEWIERHQGTARAVLRSLLDTARSSGRMPVAKLSV